MAVKRFRTKNRKQRKQRSLRKQRSQRKVSRRNTKGGRKLTRKKSKRRNVRKGKKSTRKKSQRGGVGPDRRKITRLSVQEPLPHPYKRSTVQNRTIPKKCPVVVPRQENKVKWAQFKTTITNKLKEIKTNYSNDPGPYSRFTHVCFIIMFVLILYNGGKGVNLPEMVDNFNSLANQAGIIVDPIKDNIYDILKQFSGLANNIGVGINWFINQSGQFTQVFLENSVIVISDPFINALKVFWETNPTLSITGGLFITPNLIEGLIKYAPKLIMAINNSREKLTEQLNEAGYSIINILDTTINRIKDSLIPAVKWFGITLVNAASTPLITPLLYILLAVDTINSCFHKQIKSLLTSENNHSLKQSERIAFELVGELNPPGSEKERRDSVESVQSVFLTPSTARQNLPPPPPPPPFLHFPTDPPRPHRPILPPPLRPPRPQHNTAFASAGIFSEKPSLQ